MTVRRGAGKNGAHVTNEAHVEHTVCFIEHNGSDLGRVEVTSLH